MKRTTTGAGIGNAMELGSSTQAFRTRSLPLLCLVGATIIATGCGHEPPRPGGGTTSQPRSADAESTTHLTGTSGGAASPLLPRPRSMTPTSCERPFSIDPSTTIAVDDTPDGRQMGEQLARWLGLSTKNVAAIAAAAPDPAAGIVLRVSPSSSPPPSRRDPAVAPPATLADEAYSLAIDARRALVRAPASAGLFYGAQTLAQLAGTRHIGEEDASAARDAPRKVPCLTIDDAPRFRYRAMHLDVARHFFPKETVKRYIDLLAFYRFNVFHWHLTDDQGFRIQIKSHPELTATGGPDGAYSQEDAREIIAYARARSITVIPEIEMPGHVRALLASHPELSCTGKKQDVPRTWGIFDDVLCAGNEKSFALIDEILGEVAPLFPSQLLHVGGDEVPTTRWQACAKCRAAMKANHVGIHELEGYVMRRVASTLQKLGKRPVVWDEALEGLAGGPTGRSPALASSDRPVILAWQSATRGREAARRGFDVIMAPNEHAYLNFFQSRTRTEPGHSGYLPWSSVRTFDPLAGISDERERARIIGGEGALWSEYITSPEAIDTMVMPRAAALAETLWSGPSAPSDDFVARFGAQLPMLDASNVRYFVDPPEGAPARKILVQGESATFTLTPPRLFPGAVMRWTRDGSDPTPTSPLVTGPITIRETTAIAAASFLPGGRSSPVVRGRVVVEAPRPAISTARTEQGASYAYAEGNFHELPDFGKVAVKARGRAQHLSLAELGGLRPERFALLFEGLVEAKADGVHRFLVRADDGVRLEVDGEKLLEDDGEHEPRDSSGEIALARGLHRFRVTYFQGTEGKELDVKLEGPSLPLGPLAPLSEAKR